MPKLPYTLQKATSGAQIYFIETHDSPVVNLKFIFPCGFLYFEKTEHHLPHMLEHMLFSGSPDFASEQELTQYLRTYGADANASTSPEEVAVILRVSVDGLIPAFTALANAIFRAKFSVESLEREKEVMMREVAERFDGLAEHALATTLSYVFPQQYPSTPDGHADSIRGISIDAVRSAYRACITLGRCKLVVSGKLSATQQKEVVRVMDGLVSQSHADAVTARAEKLSFGLSKNRLVESCAGLAENGYLVFNFVEKVDPTESAESKVAKNVLDGYLLSGHAASIPSELRAKGLIYSSETDLINAGNLRIYTFSLTADTDDLPEIIALVVRHLARISAGHVEPAEFENLQSYIKYVLPTYLETTADYIDWYEGDIVLGRKPRLLKDEIERVEKLSPSEVSRVAREVFWQGDIYAAAFGDTSTEKWSKEFSRLIEKVESSEFEEAAVEAAIGTFLRQARSVEAQSSPEKFWWFYGVSVFVGLLLALHVAYLPLAHNPRASVSMFDFAYDHTRWWGLLFFIPQFIGLIAEFNLYAKIKWHHLLLASTTAVSACAYFYGLAHYFGDTGKDNVPFFWQDFASIVHPLVFGILTPIALYISIRQWYRQRQTAKQATN